MKQRNKKSFRESLATKYGLRIRVTFFVALMLISISLATFFHVLSFQRDMHEEQFEDNAQTTLRYISLGLKYGIQEENYEMTQDIVNWIDQYDNVLFLVLFDDQNEIVLSKSKIELELNYDLFKDYPKFLVEDKEIIVRKTEFDSKLGQNRLFVGFSIANQIEREEDTLFEFAIWFLIIMVLGKTTTFFFIGKITRSLEDFTKISSEIAKGELKIFAEEDKGSKEIRSLARSFNLMLKNIFSKNKSLQNANDELQGTLKELKDAQSRLVLTGKMAALGQIIAGIAHEVNSPLGATRSTVVTMQKHIDFVINEMPDIIMKYNDDDKRHFRELVNQGMTNTQQLSTKEERKIRRRIVNLLESNSVKDAHLIADIIVDIGIFDDNDNIISVLKKENSNQFFKTLQSILKLKSGANTIRTATDRASKVILALKSYAHTDDPDTLALSSVHESIDTILTLYRNQIKHGIEIIRDYNYSGQVMCYPDELNQVWTNLIHNSIQAMDFKGKLKVTIDQEELFIKVSIEDNGPGIPEEVQSRIFEPFFTTKQKGEGTGLGLDIVQKIINKHQGRIDFESNIGHGTKFNVRIPLEIIKATE